MASEIKCICLSEFHPVTGPRIAYQAPEEFPIRQAFDAVHDLIITKPQLYDRLITVDVGEYRIVGCPKSILDKKYARNALIFNVVFVFDANTDTSSFEPVVQKLGEAFKSYELEASFLSQETSRMKLPSILTRIRESLNTLGLCVINIDDCNMLHLKIIPFLTNPPEVSDHHVPILACSPNKLGTISWDLAVQEIICHVDGFNHVKKIADLSEVSIDSVRECVQHLVIYGFVKLISIFQYSNVYVATTQLPQLMKDPQLRAQCVEYVSLSDVASISDVFRLLCSLEAGFTMKDLCLRNDPKSLNIDERRLIQFALMHGLIRHLQKYPILIDCAPPNQLMYLKDFLNGSYSFDEICCEVGLSNQQLDEQLELCPELVICWK